jgi:peroxiredoxin
MSHRRIPGRLEWIGAFFVVGMLVVGQGQAAEDAVPRYWLKVGQELNYRTNSEISTEDGQSLATDSTWQVWVVKQNADGSWRLILRHASMFQPPANAPKLPTGKNPSAKPVVPKPKVNPAKANPAKPVAGKSATPKAQAKTSPTNPGAPSAPVGLLEQVTFAYCDLMPDGAVTSNPTLGFQFEVRQLLLKLPKSEKELEKGWSDIDKSTLVGHRYRVEDGPEDDDDEQQWTLVATRQSPIDEIYQCRSQSTFFFDGDRGLVERIETKLEQSYGLKGTSTTTTELSGSEQFDSAWCKKLDEEMELYFAVQRRYQSLLKAAQRDSAEAETLLVEAGALLQKAAADITLPVVKEDLRKQVAQHAAIIGLTARAARDRADFIDQPAPTWQAKDLEGNAHTLRENKGKIVVMHFWRRADGWSLRALPQVEQLAEQFTEKPVVVLGMNTDASDDDARLVAEKMGLAYPILRADKFADKYNVAAASAVFVVDQKGIIRDVEAGYSPTLRQDLASAVAALLEAE